MNDVGAIVEEAFARTTKSLEKLSDLESMTLVGKPLTERVWEKVNDIDIVVITQNAPLKRAYEAFEQEMRQMGEQLSDQRTTVLHAVADGPMKPEVYTEQELFFHIIWHSADGYARDQTLPRFSWQHLKPFYGRPLKDFLWQPPLTAKRVRELPLGIESSLEAVRNNSAGAWVWKPIEEKSQENARMQSVFVEFPVFRDSEKMELYLWAVLRGASNVLRYRHGHLYDVDGYMVDSFAKEFEGVDFENVPRNAHDVKRSIRMRKKTASPIESPETYHSTAKAFLENLLQVTIEDERKGA
jgi:hypothetical protein